MSFGARTFQGMLQSAVQSGSGTASDLQTVSTASASIALNADGTITYTGNGSGGTGAWYSPSGGSPGATTWASWTVTSTSGSLGTNGSGSLSSGKTFTYSCALNATFQIGSVVVKFFSDAGLTNQVGTFTFSVDVESSNH